MADLQSRFDNAPSFQIGLNLRNLNSFNHSTLIIEANLSTSLPPQKKYRGTEDEGKKVVNPMRIGDPMKSKRLRDYALTFHQPSYPI